MLTSAVREADELAVFEGERGAVLEALELAVEERLGKADLDGVELPLSVEDCVMLPGALCVGSDEPVAVDDALCFAEALTSVADADSDTA